ncbi:MAG: amidohydrolase family protein, partial [Bacteroidales bacterium]|nr:amidohydrolase family protein [Bacteroidales bacterium]
MPRTIAAQYVFTNAGEPIKNGAVTYDEATGKILSIKPLTTETANTEFYNGVLVPGFVNAHCHLELSHLRGLIPPCKQLTEFLYKIVRLKTEQVFSDKICLAADQAMYDAGINAVGDISNTSDSAFTKSRSKIRYRNFIELLGTTEERIDFNNLTFRSVAKSLKYSNNCTVHAVPHSPYFVSDAQFDDINALNAADRSVISIHNQETAAENDLYISHSGSFVDLFAPNVANIKCTGKKSLPSYGHHLAGYDNVLLVHNTYSERDDFEYALQTFRNPFFVLCPKSNLYLEGRLPDVSTMMSMRLNICLGTDSLSSNDTLSILEEMKILVQN